MNVSKIVELYKCFETEENNKEIKQTLENLTNLLNKWGSTHKDYQLKLFSLGSYRLGINSRGGDVDVICVGSEHVSVDEFFAGFSQFLNKEKFAKNFRLVTDALIPILKLQVNTIKIDLLYAKLPLKTVPDKIADLSESHIRKMDSKSVASLNGARDAEYMDKVIKNKKCFGLAYMCIKCWAQRRGIYSNVMGFFGGYTWRLLVTYIYLQNQDASPEELVKKFFATFSQLKIWDTRNPICVSPESAKVSKFKGNNRMLVITPVEPFKNSCRNVTKSTFKYLIKEFQRGHDIVSSCKTFEDFKKLFAKTSFFEDFKLFVELKIIAGSLQDLKDWLAYVESRFVSLLEKLDNLSTLKAVPFAYPLKSKQPKYSARLVVGIEYIQGSIDFSHVVYDFINEMNEWKPKNDEMYITYQKLNKIEI